MNQAAVVISNFTPMSNPILFQKIPLTREAGLMHAKFQKIDSSVGGGRNAGEPRTNSLFCLIECANIYLFPFFLYRITLKITPILTPPVLVNVSFYQIRKIVACFPEIVEKR